MQAIILAAGKSTRTYPLTRTRPKPLLKVAGKTLIEHNLDALVAFSKEHDDCISEVIFVVGYKEDMIKDFLGKSYSGIHIRYVTQTEQKGTAHAVLMTREYITGRFIVLMGDNIYCAHDISQCAAHDAALLTTVVDEPEKYGVVVCTHGKLTNIVEKPREFISKNINAALYVLEPSFFEYCEKVEPSSRDEIEVTDALLSYAKGHDLFCVESTCWIPIGYPKDILKADIRLRNNESIVLSSENASGHIENSFVGENCVIKGHVVNSVVYDGCVVEEDVTITDCVLGYNVICGASLTRCVVGDNSRVAKTLAEGTLVDPDQTI